MSPIQRIAHHPAMAEALITELQERVDALSAYIRQSLSTTTPPEQIRAALAPETENQYEAI